MFFYLKYHTEIIYQVTSREIQFEEDAKTDIRSW